MFSSHIRKKSKREQVKLILMTYFSLTQDVQNTVDLTADIKK